MFLRHLTVEYRFRENGPIRNILAVRVYLHVELLDDVLQSSGIIFADRLLCPALSSTTCEDVAISNCRRARIISRSIELQFVVYFPSINH